MTTTSATRRLWTELVARFTAEPDLLKRDLHGHILCDATGLHDRGPDSRCRDCAKPLTDADPVCRDVPMGGPIRGAS